MSDEIKVDKGVPIPSTQRRRNDFPFAGMDVGDSFAVPYTAVSYRNLSFAARAFAQVKGWRFTVRRMKEEGEMRCWRIQ